MSHLMSNGEPCALKDEHLGCHRSVESQAREAERKRARDRKWIAAKRAKRKAAERPVLPAPTRVRLDWRESALCAEIGTDAFFPFEDDVKNNGRVSSAYAATAKRICRDCPVTAQCLEDAMRWEVDEHDAPLSRSYRFGVWGGMLPGERAALAKGEISLEVA